MTETTNTENKVGIDLNKIKYYWELLNKYKKSVWAVIFLLGTLLGHNMDKVNIEKYVPGIGLSGDIEPRVTQLEQNVNNIQLQIEESNKLLKEIEKAIK